MADDEERIEALEEAVALLLKRVAALEARPVPAPEPLTLPAVPPRSVPFDPKLTSGGSGWTCNTCGTWVPFGSSHSCNRNVKVGVNPYA